MAALSPHWCHTYRHGKKPAALASVAGWAIVLLKSELVVTLTSRLRDAPWKEVGCGSPGADSPVAGIQAALLLLGALFEIAHTGDARGNDPEPRPRVLQALLRQARRRCEPRHLLHTVLLSSVSPESCTDSSQRFALQLRSSSFCPHPKVDPALMLTPTFSTLRTLSEACVLRNIKLPGGFLQIENVT